MKKSPGPLNFDPIVEAGRQWRKHWGPEPVAPVMAVVSLMRTHQILVARLNETLEPFDLTYSRYEGLMLLHLSSAGSLPLGKIGARLQVHPTSVTSLIDGLEKQGYATRTPHPHDRRTTLAAITRKGTEIATAATLAVNAIRFGVEPLKDSELDSVIAVLTRIRRESGDFVED
jgi:DNA-binding MarR family transcriptional regulator